jgi:hypothetical protein
MKKLLSLWIPIIIMVGIGITVVVVGSNPKTTFGYELTTTPPLMKTFAWITLVVGSIVTTLGFADKITYSRNESADMLIKFAVPAATIILTMLFFINFSYDFNNPY